MSTRTANIDIAMESELGISIIAELRGVATVPVEIDTGTSNVRGSGTIVIETEKMNEIMCEYAFLRDLVEGTWSNLPPPPVTEKTHVVVWLMASRGYDVNHSSIKWDGATPNTFIHLWSIMDRIKPSLSTIDGTLLLGSRNCVDYCSTTGMSWPIDTHMYLPDVVPAAAIEKMESNMEIFKFEDVKAEFSSFYNFHMSTLTPRQLETVNISQINLDRSRRRSSTSLHPRQG